MIPQDLGHWILPLSIIVLFNSAWKHHSESTPPNPGLHFPEGFALGRLQLNRGVTRKEKP